VNRVREQDGRPANPVSGCLKNFGIKFSQIESLPYRAFNTYMVQYLQVGIVGQSFVPEIGTEEGGLRFHIVPQFTVDVFLFLWPIFTLFP